MEQDAEEIVASAVEALRRVTDGLGGRRVVTVGLSTQRESAVVWDRRTGEPVGPMLGWQDRRTRRAARDLIEAGHDPRVRRITGLPVDPMFSALKFAWLLDSIPDGRRLAERGDLALGTVDAYLVFRLTGLHRIEAGNASRTQLMDVETAQWSPELLDLFGIPAAVLPEIVPSNAHAVLTQGPLGRRRDRRGAR